MSKKHAPQSAVLGHCFAAGFVAGSQLELSQVTVPTVPDKPAPTPHVLAHPCGSPCTQLPGIGMLNDFGIKTREQLYQYKKLVW